LADRPGEILGGFSYFFNDGSFMYSYRDTASLLDVVESETDFQLAVLIEKRLQDLFAVEDEDLADMIHIMVIESSDELKDIDAELGFSLLDRPWDVVESHPGWYEITVIVSDDGFGWVIYVPKHATTDAVLLEKCATYCKESMP
jgi:hypothetical protein